MWDLELHMRMMRSSTDAMFGFASAAMAAATEWQDHMTRTMIEPEPVAAPVFDPMSPMSWWSAFLPGSSVPLPFAPSAPNFTSPLFQFASLMQAWPQSTAWSNPWTKTDPWTSMSLAFNPYAQSTPAAGFGVADMMQASMAWRQMWPAFTWTVYQLPMTAMIMSAGVPHSVASPAAKASAATLDAVDAAREQASRVFSAYRSDGGHASAQILEWPGMKMLAMLPWVAPFLPQMHG